MSEHSVELGRVDTCPTCRARDVDAEHLKVCAIFTDSRAKAIKHGRGETNIHATRTDDLWAHINSRTGNPLVALAVVTAVIDLGWRPVIGRDIWTGPKEAINA